jgi:hypothetical protein
VVPEVFEVIVDLLRGKWVEVFVVYAFSLVESTDL